MSYTKMQYDTKKEIKDLCIHINILEDSIENKKAEIEQEMLNLVETENRLAKMKKRRATLLFMHDKSGEFLKMCNLIKNVQKITIEKYIRRAVITGKYL